MSTAVVVLLVRVWRWQLTTYNDMSSNRFHLEIIRDWITNEMLSRDDKRSQKIGMLALNSAEWRYGHQTLITNAIGSATRQSPRPATSTPRDDELAPPVSVGQVSRQQEWWSPYSLLENLNPTKRQSVYTDYSPLQMHLAMVPISPRHAMVGIGLCLCINATRLSNSPVKQSTAKLKTKDPVNLRLEVYCWFGGLELDKDISTEAEL